ncbi:40133_t:CDS:2, partial [Gigaspora margarita]
FTTKELEVLKNGGLLPMKRTKTTKEQEGKPQTILNQWFKGKSKETLTQLDSDLNNKEAVSIEMLDSNLSTS